MSLNLRCNAKQNRDTYVATLNFTANTTSTHIIISKLHSIRFIISAMLCNRFRNYITGIETALLKCTYDPNDHHLYGFTNTRFISQNCKAMQ